MATALRRSATAAVGGRSCGAPPRPGAANARGGQRVLLHRVTQPPTPVLRCRAAAGEGEAAPAPVPSPPTAVVASAPGGPLRVELGTVGARSSIRFDVAPMGYGQAIVTVAVAAGSEAEEAGVRPGMRLTAISDPIRRNEVWKLQDRPSLKNIRELLKMRSSDTIELEFEPWDGPLPSAGFDGSLVSSSATSAAPSVAASLSSMDGGSSSGNESIGERLARQYAESAAAGRAPTAVEARQRRRRERMEADAARDDRPFLLGVLALFVLPPLVILLVAQSSGYLDSLYLNTLTRGS